MTLTLRAPESENLAGQDTGRDHLSHSTLSTFLACHRKFKLDKVDRLSLIAPPRYFDLGKIFQRCIELQDPSMAGRLLRGWEPCERCKGTGRAPGVFGEVGGLCAICEGAGGKQGPGPRISDQADEDRLRREEVMVEAAAALYLRTWPANVVERREFEYRIRLRNPATGAYSLTFDLLGYADGVVDHGDWIELIENKLLGQIDELTIRRLPLDRQIALARYAIWRATGKTVRRVRYRIVRKPSIKQRGGRKKDKSDAETLDAFLERLADDYRERPDFYTHEELLFARPEDALRIEAELWEWAEQLRQQRRRAVWDRNTSHCLDYGGCAFLPICTGDPDARALYQVRPERETTNATQKAAA